MQHRASIGRRYFPIDFRARGHNRYFILYDLVFIACVVFVSFVLRLEMFALAGYWPEMTLTFLLTWPAVAITFYLTGTYSRYWLQASLDEMLLLIQALSVSLIPLFGLVLVVFPVLEVTPNVPRSIPFILAPIAFLGVAGVRFATRLLDQHLAYLRNRQSINIDERTSGDGSAQVNVLIVGASMAGLAILRELRQHPERHEEVIGFIDNDKNKHGLRMHGIRIHGGYEDIPQVTEQFAVARIIIAMPDSSGKEIRGILKICEQTSAKAQVIPGFHELINGHVQLNQVRNVQIEDLLRREPIKTDMEALKQLLYGKRVLITGGGGSIGSELCQQILRTQPAEMVIVGHGENSVFNITNDLRHMMDEMTRVAQEAGTQVPAPCVIRPVIADIRSARRIEHIFAMYQPQIVFHAAAHKHVPLMENNPTEAISNNILGTRNLVNAAVAEQVERFVMVSTDKAVNPTSIMGASKRVCELIVHQAAERSGLPFVAVRFGNVLGSRGSVVWTFRKQIAAGGPVTLTHPDIERYFMTIPEAVQLVLQAAILGKGGEVFTLDMGEPVKIADLARDMVKLSGLQLGRDVDLKYIGLRPGEKLYEELFTPLESFHRTQHEKIFIAENASRAVPVDLDYNVNILAQAVEEYDIAAIFGVLCNLIPEGRLEQAIAATRVAQVNADDPGDKKPDPGFRFKQALVYQQAFSG